MNRTTVVIFACCLEWVLIGNKYAENMSCGCMSGSHKNTNMKGMQMERGVDSGDTQNALDILKARYAGGEIARDEYMKMREDINAGD